MRSHTKLKHSDRRLRRLTQRIAFALIVVVLALPLMWLSYVFGNIFVEDRDISPEDALLANFYRETDSYIIFKQQRVEKPAGAAYLVGWHNKKQQACIGFVWQGEPGGFEFSVNSAAKADCVSRQYSIDQFWDSRYRHPTALSVAYGFSGDAAQVIVTWQDDEQSTVTPVNGVYLVARDAKSRVIESVEFFDADGARLFRFPDDARKSDSGAGKDA